MRTSGYAAAACLLLTLAIPSYSGLPVDVGVLMSDDTLEVCSLILSSPDPITHEVGFVSPETSGYYWTITIDGDEHSSSNSAVFSLTRLVTTTGHVCLSVTDAPPYSFPSNVVAWVVP